MRRVASHFKSVEHIRLKAEHVISQPSLAAKHLLYVSQEKGALIVLRPRRSRKEATIQRVMDFLLALTGFRRPYPSQAARMALVKHMALVLEQKTSVCG